MKSNKTGISLLVLMIGIGLVCRAADPAPGTLEVIPNPFSPGSEPPEGSLLFIDGKSGLESSTNAPTVTFSARPDGTYVLQENENLSTDTWANKQTIYNSTANYLTYRYYIDQSPLNKSFKLSSRNEGGVMLDVHPSTGTSFSGPDNWGVNLEGEYEAIKYLEGDYNGDGKTDIAALWHSVNGNANINVYASGGVSFTTQNWLLDTGAISEDMIWLSGDYTGDGKCDMAVVRENAGVVYIDVYPSTGTGFAAPVAWAANQGPFTDEMIWMSGDYTGDGKCDIMKVWNDAGSATADVHPSNGSSFSMTRFATTQGTISAEMSWMSGDFNGDGFCDIAKTFDQAGQIAAEVHPSNGSIFTGVAPFASNQGNIWGGMKWFAGNFDGTGSDDISKLWVNFSLPKVVETLYATEDHVVVDANVLNYGADDTGVWDSTAAIQTALDAVFNAGGGTVWLPVGKYRVTGGITIHPNVCLQGDWDDPDTDDYIGGTIIIADLVSGGNSPILFSIGNSVGSSGVKGVTVFYPNQNATSPLEYNYTFHIPAGALGTVENCTMINSYKGIGVSTGGAVHYCHRLRNVKGTVLHTGYEAYNSSDVGTAENVRFSNAYWANSGSDFNAPDLATLNNWTRNNGTGFIIGDLEWSQFYNIYCSDYAVGIKFVPGPRIYSQCSFFSSTVENCTIAVQALPNSVDDRWGSGFERCTLSGTTGIANQSSGYIRLTDCVTAGGTSGTVHVDSRGVSPLDPGMVAMPKGSNKTLYVVTDAPYNAPRTLIGGGDTTGNLSPTTDATAAIQSALNAAGTAGGGIVYVPAGWYRINGHLSVPANVELRGASSISFKSEWGASRNTWLFCYEDKGGSRDNTPAITLNNGSGVNGVGFFYPEQNPETYGSIASYPTTIRADGASDIYVNNVAFFNAYQGMRFNSCPDHFVKNVMGTSFFRFAWLATASGQVSTVLNNPVYCVQNGWSPSSWANINYGTTFPSIILPWTRANQLMFDFTAVSGEKIFNAFTYGAAYVGDSYDNSNVEFYNLGSDNIGSAGFFMDTGTVKVSNYSRYNGVGSIGEGAFIYNHMAINEGYIPNP